MANGVVVCSIIRNGMSYLPRYLDQLHALRGDIRKIVIVEGDSTDGTAEELDRQAKLDTRLEVHHFNTGTRKFGSVIHEERLRAMSSSMNLALDVALSFAPRKILYLTADLRIEPNLLESLDAHDLDIVAPYILWGDQRFWDIWAFRIGTSILRRGPGGARGCFRARPPYHPKARPDRPFEVDSAGSVLLIRAEIVEKGVRFTPDEDVVGFCRTARRLGYKIWADPSTVCQHDAPEVPA